LEEEIEVLGENLPPVPLCPPQIPHELTWARTRTAAMGTYIYLPPPVMFTLVFLLWSHNGTRNKYFESCIKFYYLYNIRISIRSFYMFNSVTFQVSVSFHFSCYLTVTSFSHMKPNLNIYCGMTTWSVAW
jgi:hypothetical protein